MATKNYRFYKSMDNWYIDLPEFIEQGIGDQDSLQMVAGADIWLDIISENKNEVNLEISTSAIDGGEVIDMIHSEDEDLLSGEYYIAKTYKGVEVNHQMWLCMVTLYVFKYYPNHIYYKVI